MNRRSTKHIAKVFLVCALAATGVAVAAARAAFADTQTDAAGAEKVDVQSIEHKYWARGQETELAVVQNRAYTKAKRFELTIFGGVLATDPFLAVENVGGSLGYFFSEYFSLHVLGWKSFYGPSSALTTFQNTIGATTDSNPPYGYLGGEAQGSFLYGKLSLFGSKILYFDTNVMGGMGSTFTYSGAYFTPHVGIGEQFYLSRHFSIKLDYRVMLYNETILEQVIPTKLGQPVGTRLNITHAVTLGISFMFGKGDQ